VVPLLAGAALLGWAVAEHYAAAADESWSFRHGLEPEYLVTGGPYRFGRNPMYVGGVAIWGGCALLLGRAPVAAGLVVLTPRRPHVLASSALGPLRGGRRDAKAVPPFGLLVRSQAVPRPIARAVGE
jgi:Phospholipid methyltransferase